MIHRLKKHLMSLWKDERGDMGGVVLYAISFLVIAMVIGIALWNYDFMGYNLKDGTYNLAGGTVQPLSSVVFDTTSQDYHVEVEGSNKHYDISQNQVTFKITKGQRKLVATHHQYTIYLHASDEVAKITNNSSKSGLFIIPFIR